MKQQGQDLKMDEPCFLVTKYFGTRDDVHVEREVDHAKEQRTKQHTYKDVNSTKLRLYQTCRESHTAEVGEIHVHDNQFCVRKLLCVSIFPENYVRTS